MRGTFGVVRNERGGGLLMALLVIVALAAITASIVASVTTDRRLTSYNMLRERALDLAEAGEAEALERIRIGDVPDNRNAHMVSQIFLANPGSVPAVGTDTVAMGTDQPSGAWLPYSSDSQGPDVLTIQYMTNSARTGIYLYDATKSPAIQGKTGNPVFMIHSVAHVGVSRRAVDAVVTPVTISPNIKAAYVGANDIKFHGTDYAIGYDYTADTPSGTGSDGARHNTYETGSNNVPGVWGAKTVDIKSPSKAIGTPSNSLQNQSGFYSGPWDALNMQQSQFYDWIGSPNTLMKNGDPVPSGKTYLKDPHAKPQKGKQTFKLKGGNGDGILYVDGNLEIDGDFTFRGLIYVEGDVNFKGTAWILGAVVVADKNSFKTSHHEQMTVMKSNQAIQQFIDQHGSPFLTLSWRES